MRRKQQLELKDQFQEGKPGQKVPEEMQRVLEETHQVLGEMQQVLGEMKPGTRFRHEEAKKWWKKKSPNEEMQEELGLKCRWSAQHGLKYQIAHQRLSTKFHRDVHLKKRKHL